MDDSAFDAALVAAAFDLAAARGWPQVSVAEAARRSGLDLARARARFPNRAAILLRFGVQADQAALAEPAEEPAVRERLFDLLMRRFDAMQPHRDGIVAVLRALPFDPAMMLLLSTATARSMGWMLEAAGVPATGLGGRLRAQGLVAVWLSALRAWEQDDSPDLSGTMSGLDKALNRAEQAASWLHMRRDGADTIGDVDDLPADLPVVDLPDDDGFMLPPPDVPPSVSPPM